MSGNRFDQLSGIGRIPLPKQRQHVVSAQGKPAGPRNLYSMIEAFLVEGQGNCRDEAAVEDAVTMAG